MYKVAIVEDDFRIADINKAFVEQVEGFEVIGVALNGKSFIQLLKEKSPQLVLLDIYIPDISGEELLLYIKKNFPNIDVIMITAAKEMKTLEFCLQHGIFDYLIKPIHATRLHKSLEKYRAFKEKLNKKEELDQRYIDAILDRTEIPADNNVKYPKGIDSITLERVKNFLTSDSNGYTAEEIGKPLGISRSTARRYLEYLVNTNILEADLRYGTVGRPERIYRMR